MELIEIRQYDERKSYGVDWVTEYVCESESYITFQKALGELEKLGHKPVGELSYSYDGNTKKLIITAKMY